MGLIGREAKIETVAPKESYQKTRTELRAK